MRIQSPPPVIKTRWQMPSFFCRYLNIEIKKRALALYLNIGDAYGIRTRECMRERHMS